MGDASTTADPTLPLAVLVSGGADSAILVGEAVRAHPAVHPIFVRFGLTWEPAELAHLRNFLAAIACPALRSLVVLDLPAADLYGQHWALTGVDVPAAGTPDEAVFLPGRNALLLVKSLLWCHLHRVSAVALGLLERNPFPDGTFSFFANFSAAVNQSVNGSVRVVVPYRGLSKEEVLRRGQSMPLQHTFSCIRPINNQHCGACNKCEERHKGFRDAGLPDPTFYAQGLPCSA
jgi:7-cyano-7-deazaguanine synthase